MATETLVPNGDDGGWPTGGFADIDEDFGSPDAATMETSIDDDVVVLDLSPSAIVDGDTVTGISIDIRAKDTGAGGKNQVEIDVDVGGGGLGSVKSGNLTNTFANYNFVNAAWDLDHSAAEMDAMQLIVKADQTGMGTAADWIIDTLRVIATFTPAAGGPPRVSLLMAQYQPG